LQASERELPKTHHLLDDPKHGLDSAFALAVLRSALPGLQGAGHVDHGVIAVGLWGIHREAFF
jgi:hypothetical protein